MKNLYVVVAKNSSEDIDRIIAIEGIFKSEDNAKKRFNELEMIYRYSGSGLWFDMYDIPTDLLEE